MSAHAPAQPSRRSSGPRHGRPWTIAAAVVGLASCLAACAGSPSKPATTTTTTAPPDATATVSSCEVTPVAGVLVSGELTNGAKPEQALAVDVDYVIAGTVVSTGEAVVERVRANETVSWFTVISTSRAGGTCVVARVVHASGTSQT